MQNLSAKEKGLEMKLRDFNFRIWHPNRGYLDSPVYYFYQSEKDRDNICELEIWTGLKDIKGQKLYENDIVRWGACDDLSDEFGIICCENSDFIGLHFYVNAFDGKGNFKERFALAKINTHFVIIGNTHKEKK